MIEPCRVLLEEASWSCAGGLGSGEGKFGSAIRSATFQDKSLSASMQWAQTSADAASGRTTLPSVQLFVVERYNQNGYGNK